MQFQPALPRGERRLSNHPFFLHKVFQPALPRGERPVPYTAVKLGRRDFNPRSHEGSDGTKSSDIAQIIIISTRAPTRGATVQFVVHFVVHCISTRAPTRGATRYAAAYATERRNFNPRSHEGSDRWPANLSLLSRFIFQPALPRGERLVTVYTLFDFCKFQPALPRGERLYQCGYSIQ